MQPALLEAADCITGNGDAVDCAFCTLSPHSINPSVGVVSSLMRSAMRSSVIQRP